jgi:hypothetical protein
LEDRAWPSSSLAADAVKISIESMRVGRVDGEAPMVHVATVEIRR